MSKGFYIEIYRRNEGIEKFLLEAALLFFIKEFVKKRAKYDIIYAHFKGI
jgi:hypothetical protein